MAAKRGLPLLLWCLTRLLELAVRIVILSLLLQSAVEKLWLESSIAACGWLLGTHASKWISHRHLWWLLNRLLHHRLLWPLLTDTVPVTHDFESSIFRIRWVGLRVVLHHIHNVVNHILLVLLLVGRLLDTLGWSDGLPN